METRFSRDRIRSAVVAVADMFPTVMQGASWVSQSEGYLWSELVACILGSQVSHEMCSAAHERLDRHGLLDVGPASDLDDLGQDLACVLSLPFERADNSFHFSGRYRFARSKSRQIAVTASRLYGNSRGLRAILGGTTNPRIARRKLIGLCCGIGPKQSSL